MLALLNRRVATVVAGAVVMGLAASANAAIVFSNVTIAGTPSLIAGATFATGGSSIDFTTPNAVVGDFQVTRQGTMTITYEATSTDAMMNSMVAIFLGGVSGSGQIQFSEVIEDMVNPGIIATLPTVTINSNSQLPFVANLTYSRASTHIKVKKEFFLIAEPDTNAFDLARVALIEQNIGTVPEPATMAALGLGLAGIVARRRRK